MSDNETTREYTRLVREHSRVLLRYSLRRLDDPTSCEDVVAETFLIAWRRWDDLPAPGRELPWLYGIAFRVVSNYRRSRDRRDRLYTRLAFERDRQSEREGEDDPDTQLILRAIRELRTSERELLEFVYWERLTYRDIALIVGVSENAVGIRINRAKGNLRTLLALPQDGIPPLTILRGEVDS
ncbi:MAG: RNA polymerase sigma factor [Acidimicrobiales bacterium]